MKKKSAFQWRYSMTKFGFKTRNEIEVCKIKELRKKKKMGFLNLLVLVKGDLDVNFFHGWPERGA